MKKIKNYFFGFILITSGALIIGSGGSGLTNCVICDGTGRTDCIYCANDPYCTFCNGNGDETCTFCNGTGK